MKRIALLISFSLALANNSALAQEFPTKPIVIIVGSGAGGMADTSTRLLADELDRRLGVRVLVENHPGAGGLLALKEARQRNDGYTIVGFSTDNTFTATYQGRGIAMDDWRLLGSYMPQERVLFASADAPFKDVAGMIEYGKQNAITFAGGGFFWSTTVVEAFAKKNSMTMNIAPFKSGAEGSAAIMGGHVMTAEAGVGTPAWTAAKEGGLKMLATLTPGGLSAFGYPNVKSIGEQGADHTVLMLYGLAVPAGVPKERADLLERTFAEIGADPEAQERFRKIDLTLQWSLGQDYSEQLKKVTQSAEALRTVSGK